MAQMIKYKRNNYSDIEDIQTICGAVCKCVKAIKICDTTVRDGKNIRSSKPGQATIWEMRQAMGWSGEQEIDRRRYKGTILPNGDVKVDDRLTGKPYYITARELAEKENEYYANKGYTTGAAIRAFTGGGFNQSANVLNRQLLTRAMSQNNNNGALNNNPVNNNAVTNEEKQSGGKMIKTLTTVATIATLLTAIFASIEKISQNQNTSSFISNTVSKLGNAVSSLFRSKKEAENINKSGLDITEVKEFSKRMEDLQKSVNELKDDLRSGKDVSKAIRNAEKKKKEVEEMAKIVAAAVAAAMNGKK